MSASAAALLSEVLRLSEEERAMIAAKLLATIPVEAQDVEDEEFEVELDRRLEDFRRDPQSGIPWTELKEQK
jgi:putative addiction module component (TIGR02574 family)